MEGGNGVTGFLNFSIGTCKSTPSHTVYAGSKALCIYSHNVPDS